MIENFLQEKHPKQEPKIVVADENELNSAAKNAFQECFPGCTQVENVEINPGAAVEGNGETRPKKVATVDIVKVHRMYS